MIELAASAVDLENCGFRLGDFVLPKYRTPGQVIYPAEVVDMQVGPLGGLQLGLRKKRSQKNVIWVYASSVHVVSLQPEVVIQQMYHYI